MACTTILVGKKASNDGSTMIARNDDGYFDEKKIIVVNPKDIKKKYKSKIAHLEIELPDNPLSYTSCPSINDENGIWAACGINSKNVGMTATETITSNPRVVGADPYCEYNKDNPKVPGGIGEEDLVVLVLPYISSAREGVIRLGSLLEKYGTYEANGIAFNDENEVWWLESIGGHHWIAKKVKDDEVVIMPNQFGLDNFDFEDAFSSQVENMCSPDLKEFIDKYHLDLNKDIFNPRNVFGSHSDADHVYNTPRGWYMGRCLCPTKYKWEGAEADFTPESDNIPWSLVPEKKVTVEDVKYILSSYYQGTPYNPYGKSELKGKYRPIGISRTGVMAILQIRSNVEEKLKAVEWVCFGANPFNACLPVYTNVNKMPKYLSNVTLDVSTENFYWTSRLIGALVDPIYSYGIQHIERYQSSVQSKARALINEYDAKYKENPDDKILLEANEKIAQMGKKEATKTLTKLTLIASEHMKCGYSRADN